MQVNDAILIVTHIVDKLQCDYVVKTDVIDREGGLYLLGLKSQIGIFCNLRNCVKRHILISLLRL